MRISNYIKKELKKGRRKFNIGSDDGETVNENSLNRIKFTLKKAKK